MMDSQTIFASGDPPDLSTTASFFRMLYGDGAPGHLCLFTLPEKRTQSWPANRLEDAESAALELNTNVYFGIGLQREIPGSGRGNEAGVVAIPGFWLDLDIRDAGAHVQNNLPGNEDEALQFVEGLDHQPTVIVHSGHGLQLYWLFEGPWVLEGEDARGEAKRASRAWQARILEMAAQRGWRLDSTADLARIFRVPGTQNHKGEPAVPVRILVDDGPRYAREELIEVVGDPGSSPERTTPLTPAQVAKLAAPGTQEDQVRYTAHMLQAIPNDERFNRGKWVGMAHAVRASCGAGNEDEARQLFVEWSETWTADVSEPGEAERVWDTLGKSNNTGGYEYLWDQADSTYELPDDHPWRAENFFSADPTLAPVAGIYAAMQKVRSVPDPASPEFMVRLEDAVDAVQHLTSARQQVLARGLLLKALESPLGRWASDVLAVFERSRDESDEPPFATLEELLANPELLEPPEATIPRLAYKGRVVLLAGPDKSGKSTLMAHAAAALTRNGAFLNEQTHGERGGRVVWVGLEEAPSDAVRRFKELDAEPGNVDLITNPDSDVLRKIRERLGEQPADLVVIDSLLEFARLELGEAPKSGDDSGWATVMRPLVRISRDFNIAVVVLHHVRKSDGQYRGSTEIAAAVDALLELSMPGKTEDPNLRHISGRGRAGMWGEPFDVALGDGGYEISNGGEIPLEAHILSHVRLNPGVSLKALRDAVGVRHPTVRESVRKLIKAGELENRGDENRWSLHIPPTAQEFFASNVTLPSPGHGADEVLDS